ncbi:MAG: hypothetical protein DRG78_01870 [Epsilonproteobacteria bacterium]|nr:MAG: hypothetical protein DRG78_01870 [Campylobacterota bacterium]
MATVFGVTKTIVSGIWEVGNEAYKGGQEAMTKMIDEETELKLKIKTGKSTISKDSIEFIQERKIVKKEIQKVSLKGGLISILTFGILG